MTYRILSIDGGGVKGVFALQILKLIEEEIDKEFVSKIDCIAGTSTGALIGMALSLGFSPAKLLFLYRLFGYKVFGRCNRDPMQQAKYGNENLKASMLKVLPQDPTFGEVDKDLIITACRLHDPNLNRWKEEVYDNYTEQGRSRHLIDTVLRSASAPLYFPSYQGCVDGGIYALNPSLLALSRSIDPKGGKRSLQEIRILSLGNGQSPSKISEEIDWGVMNWMQPYKSEAEQPLFSLLTEIGSEIPHYPLMQLLGDRYLRINSVLPYPIEIDDVHKISALRKAAKAVKQDKPEFWEHCKYWVRNVFLP